MDKRILPRFFEKWMEIRTDRRNGHRLLLRFGKSRRRKKMNWPFPTHPPTPWTAKQIKEYAQQQRAQTEDALL